MTLDEAKRLRYREVVHEDECVLNVGPRGGVRTQVTEWRVNGKIRTWVREPYRVEIPAKHGLRECYTFDSNDLQHLHREQDCPLAGLDLWAASRLEA